MQELIDVYKKRLKTAQILLSQLNRAEDRDARTRILAKVNCYNYFIFELELLKEKFAEIEEQNSAEGIKITEEVKSRFESISKSTLKMPRFKYETVYISSN